MRWKDKQSYWLTRPIFAHCSGSAGCWKTRAREENSRPRSRTTTFTLDDSCATQQTRQRIVQCKPSYTIVLVCVLCFFRYIYMLGWLKSSCFCNHKSALWKRLASGWFVVICWSVLNADSIYFTQMMKIDKYVKLQLLNDIHSTDTRYHNKICTFQHSSIIFSTIFAFT